MKIIITSFTLTLIIMTTGCTTTPQPQQDLSSYLDQFIGQSEATLKSQLNFKTLGYSHTSQPVKTSDGKLVYRIQRPIAIPMPTFTGNTGGPYGSTAPKTASFAESYNVYLNCDISFHLNQQKVTKWTYAGRAC